MSELPVVRVAAVQATPVILDLEASAVPGSGELVAGPLYDTEGVVVADCDLKETLRSKRWFDVAGHDSRAHVLWPRQ
jgi:hypothetical protein